jgi:hypothetical protein
MRLFDIGILECTEASKLNPVHALIHKYTHEWFTHCIVCKNEFGDIWDATIGGIQDHNLFEHYRGRRVTILRLRQEGFTIDNDKLLAWMATTKATSKGYDYAALIGFYSGLEIQDEHRWFCSELCYWLFQANRYPLTRLERTWIYPADLYYNNEFRLVEEFVIPEIPMSDFPDISVTG